MQKLFDKILSFRGDEWRPFAVEVSQDEIRLAVYGGAKGFDEPATAETAPHDDLGSCLLEGIVLLEQSRLLSPSRAPYHRGPHHRCVFFKAFHAADRAVEVRRRRLMRAVPPAGDRVRFSTLPTIVESEEMVVKEVCWQLGHDEVHLWAPVVKPVADDFDRRVTLHLTGGWEVHREYKFPPPT